VGSFQLPGYLVIPLLGGLPYQLSLPHEFVPVDLTSFVNHRLFLLSLGFPFLVGAKLDLPAFVRASSPGSSSANESLTAYFAYSKPPATYNPNQSVSVQSSKNVGTIQAWQEFLLPPSSVPEDEPYTCSALRHFFCKHLVWIGFNLMDVQLPEFWIGISRQSLTGPL
jgi:hypothetical protein